MPVYLDGDDAGAQSKDTFNVSGYPTVVVLDADRANSCASLAEWICRNAGVLIRRWPHATCRGSAGHGFERNCPNLEQCRRLAWWLEPDLGGDAAGSTKLAKQLDAAEHCGCAHRARAEDFRRRLRDSGRADALVAQPSEARAHGGGR